ncbi:hypothetical protein HZC08_01965, partial [Candidatus Micrarchaeota archaeon]|nr:hypothetical protein [Candidatus Micrarchaeota archaeon]
MLGLGLYHEARKHSTIVESTIGPRKPGLKASALRADRAAIEAAGLGYPDNVAFTSRFFGRFLLESGARATKNPEEAKRRILDKDFFFF